MLARTPTVLPNTALQRVALRAAAEAIPHVRQETLIPLVRSMGRKLKNAEVVPDPHLDDLMDRTLKGFDQLKDLADALRKIDTRGITR